MNRKVFISVLAYDGWLPVPQSTCLMSAVMQLTMEKGFQVSYHFRIGDSILPRARNAEFSNFMGSDCTDMLLIDADTIVGAPDIAKLLSYDEHIVAAPYRTRNEPLVWSSIRWLHNDVKKDHRGLLEVECVGTGFLKVSREAAQKVWDAETTEYKDPTCKSGVSKPVFWFEIQQGHLWGEDLVFCQKLRKQGYKVFVDPSIASNHIGQQSFPGKLDDWLAANPAVMIVDDILGMKTHVNNHFSHEFEKPIDKAELVRRQAEAVALKEVPPLAPAPTCLHLPETEAA